ncbi:MAG: lipoyl(octanoyl) transferase LipB [Synechococcaceae cyanobacterium SM2_3_60]|nr:lipoyl(octanoyl) transferase LipB [Synechococcaceae cyanobacterium SM2_3_60]
MQPQALADGLLLLSHPPVYTLGQGASLEHLRFDPTDPAYELHRVERGGEVTYHGPGQWVGYALMDLRRHQQDLHWYLRQLEAVLMTTLGEFGLKGERLAGLTGVWVEGCKVAAIGIRATRWITWNGFALNVNPDLRAFEAIVPCGIRDRPVGCLADFIPHVCMSQVEPILAAAFAAQFDCTLKAVNLAQWLGEADGLG